METRANFILIGAFTVAGFVGILGFFLWFAGVELDERYAYYDVNFASVSGLSMASDVRFAGFPVGQVVDIRLSPDRDGTVQVRLEIDAETPVRVDSEATIESQGVTGVSYVGISAGTPEAPMLEAASEQDVPVIQAGRSVLQSLSEDAPELLSEALEVVQDLNALLSSENRDRVDEILGNVAEASASFSTVLEDFSAVTAEVSDFSEQIDRFNTTLETLSDDLSVVLQTADGTLNSVTALAEDGQDLLQRGQGTLDATTRTIDSAQGFLSNDLPALTIELQGAIADLRRELLVLTDEASVTLATINDAGSVARDRFEEAGPLIAETSALIASFEEASDSIYETSENIDLLFEEDGQWLIDEMRIVVADTSEVVDIIAEAAREDLPVVLEDVRSATATARRVIDEVGASATATAENVLELSDEAEAALVAATTTFETANNTLEAVDAALETGNRTLIAAERAFNGADRVINTEVAAITEDLRSAITSFDTAIAEVSEDIPALSQDLREAAAAAQATFVELQRVVAQTGAPVATFAREGLPQYSALASETRRLIRNLDSLARQLSRDPTRLLLDRDTPEFRR
ncbi:phospholipid/cholesterol/gamma-HCH transport system substrate-binding protein [Roseivivax lentus]|uniref:Phospholipid/cholesterol/gamma-HCH transport system substrate-binding protein n=1 Tax=Roseivivax lentus TaxID=633194 RepID=A0A1N7NH09_9RHOB|nr:MlaD family protein [Roseivivax lentus]SIS97469.1 phospholipid/cholesterol/gamma-HCH transport system substrate-binding protein [Roseivivax lentus]